MSRAPAAPPTYPLSFPSDVLPPNHHDPVDQYKSQLRATLLEEKKDGKYCTLYWNSNTQGFEHQLFKTEQEANNHLVDLFDSGLVRDCEGIVVCVGKEEKTYVRRKKKKKVIGEIHFSEGPYAVRSHRGEYPDSFVFTTVLSSRGKKISYNMFVDSLSDSTSIDSSVISNLNPRPAGFVTVNGTPARAYWLDVEIGDGITRVIADLDVDDTALLGRDVLNHYKVVLDFPNNTCSMEG